MPTKQETFDTVVKALIVQGAKAIDNGRCVYEMADGRKCAAGHLLPPGYNWASARGTIYRNHAVRDVLRAEGHSLDLVGELQEAHDRASDRGFVDDFLSDCRHVARNHNLDPSACDWRPDQC